MADLKPICGEKIGLIYHPLFIVHILFVNPTNYSLSCSRPRFRSGFHPLAHTRAHKNVRNKSVCYSENQIWQLTLAQSERAGKMATIATAPTKGALFSQKAAGGRSHGTKTWDTHAATSYHKPFSVSLTNTHMINCPLHKNLRVGVSMQEISRIGNTGNCYRLSRTTVAVPGVITYGFLYSKRKRAYSFCNHCSCPYIIKPQSF